MIKSSDKLDSEWNYEAKVAEVEAIIATIEGGGIRVGGSFLSSFAVAVKSLCECENFLRERQQEVDLLIENLQDD